MKVQYLDMLYTKFEVKFEGKNSCTFLLKIRSIPEANPYKYAKWFLVELKPPAHTVLILFTSAAPATASATDIFEISANSTPKILQAKSNGPMTIIVIW